jgi:hypothetical protein
MQKTIGGMPAYNLRVISADEIMTTTKKPEVTRTTRAMVPVTVTSKPHENSLWQRKNMQRWNRKKGTLTNAH